ncbi:MAG: calcium/sodium antiporter [Hyphomonadaceae bacterium]
MMYLMILGGLVLLYLGGEALVRGAVSIARRLGMSELLIGLTLVGFGTSMPELVTSLRAINMDAVGVAVGNVAGSNIANILLVLGIAALIRPIITHPGALARDMTVLILTTAAFAYLVYFDRFTSMTGMILVGCLIAYLILSVVLDTGSEGEAATMHIDEGGIVEQTDALPLALLIAFGGIVGVVFGARLLVDGSVDLARSVGVSEAVIGLSIVAIGTSLPELATSIVAAFRGKSDVAVGNVVGSSIFNILGVLGVTAIVKPFSVGGAAEVRGMLGEVTSLLTWTDMGALFLSLFMLILFGLTGKKLARWEGGVMLLAYFTYLGMLYGIVPTPFA